MRIDDLHEWNSSLLEYWWYDFRCSWSCGSQWVFIRMKILMTERSPSFPQTAPIDDLRSRKR